MVGPKGMLRLNKGRLCALRQVPLECDINIAVNGCSGFATSTQKGPFMAMLISHARGTYLFAGKWEGSGGLELEGNGPVEPAASRAI